MRTSLVLFASGVALLISPSANAAKTYFIDQVMNHTAPCTQNNLFDDTTSLKSRMDAVNSNGADLDFSPPPGFVSTDHSGER